MLKDVSWPQYFAGVCILLFVYYTLIWLILFKASPSVLYRFVRFGRRKEVQAPFPQHLAISLNDIKEELSEIFVGRTNKTELVMAIKGRLTPYYHLVGPELGREINQYIANESVRVCSIRLEDVDFRVIWE